MTPNEPVRQPPVEQGAPVGQGAVADERLAAIVPRARPGYRSRRPPDGVSAQTKVELVAALLKAGVGLTCLVAALLFMPVHLITPIFSGVACVMIVTGTHAVWRTGIVERRLRRPTRVLAWVIPVLTVGIFLLMAALGPGAFGPDWDAAPRPNAAPERVLHLGG